LTRLRLAGRRRPGADGASTAATASSRYAYTTPGLLASAKANPAQTFNVIIQGDADKTTGAIASVVKNTG
jgi:hypothetical protein